MPYFSRGFRPFSGLGILLFGSHFGEAAYRAQEDDDKYSRASVRAAGSYFRYMQSGIRIIGPMHL